MSCLLARRFLSDLVSHIFVNIYLGFGVCVGLRPSRVGPTSCTHMCFVFHIFLVSSCVCRVLLDVVVVLVACAFKCAGVSVLVCANAFEMHDCCLCVFVSSDNWYMCCLTHLILVINCASRGMRLYRERDA
jgi:hypothetical protein